MWSSIWSSIYRSSHLFLVLAIFLTLILALACASQATAVPTPTRPVVELGPVPEEAAGLQVPVFAEVATPTGTDFQHSRAEVFFNIGGGAAAADYNGDGWLDLYVTNSRGANALYRNNGDGTFTDVAADAGVADPEAQSNGAAWGDYDNDGNIDLFISNYGTSKLYRNQGDGAFQDVTESSGVGDPNVQHRSTGVAWGDYDRDGYLDLMVVRWITEGDPMVMVTGEFQPLVRPLSLFHNNGDGTFTDVKTMLGDPRDYPSKVKGAGFKPSFVDYDNDGDPDIYVVNDFGKDNYPNVLWRNDGPDGQGGWKFTDVSSDSGTDVAISGMGLAVGDFDNDTDLDFYMTNMGPSEFLENQGDGTFADITTRTGAGRGDLPGEHMGEHMMDEYSGDSSGDSMMGDSSGDTMMGDSMMGESVGWGTAFVDVNNDGFLDLYYVAGALDEAQPNALLLNNGRGAFVDVSSASHTDDTGVGRGLVCADFNNDGLPDLYVVNLGSEDGTPGTARLYQNASDYSNHWLSVKLVGTKSNRDGIGARIKVLTTDLAQVREMGASESHVSHSVVPAHFGLGTSARAETVEVRWPSGMVQTLTDIPADQLLTVTEPAS